MKRRGESPEHRQTATEARKARRAARWAAARNGGGRHEPARNWTMRKVPKRFAQFLYVVMWMAGVAWAAAGERSAGAALILAAAAGLVAPIDRGKDEPAGLRGYAAVALLLGAVGVLVADVLA